MQMHFVLKIILTIIFVPLFLILLIAVTFRFQFLVPTFWENTFSTSNTYSNLAVSINKNLVAQTISEGGSRSDVNILTDLITPENLKDVINKNIVNVLSFANGSAKEIIVYVPINKIPKSLLTKNFGSISDQMSLTTLLKEFNVSGITPAEIQMVSRLGISAWVFLITFTAITVLVLYCLYLLVDQTKRLIAPGVALILAGVAGMVTYLLGTVIRINWTKDLAGSTNTGDSIIGTVAPPVIGAVVRVWLIYAITLIILGIVLFFIKKPGYNKGRKSL
jgi:hypothetical protein